MTDSEIDEMVGAHTTAIIKVANAELANEMTTEFYKNVHRIAANMEPDDALAFRNRVSEYIDIWLTATERQMDIEDALDDAAARDRSFTDSEIMEIVSRNMRGSLDPGSDREHVFRFHREIDALAEQMSDVGAAAFKSRAGNAFDKWIDAMQQAVDSVPDTPPPRYRRNGGSSYVERTVVRAVIWNTVNSIFRVFR